MPSLSNQWSFLGGLLEDFFCINYQRDTLVRQSIITLALLHKFVYEFRGNNTYIIQDRTALHLIPPLLMY